MSYNKTCLFYDIRASIVLSLISIVLSMAIAMSANIPIQYAFVSAIIGGILPALFSNNKLSISGPAIALSIIIGTTYKEYGTNGIIIVTAICGSLQIMSSMLRVGRFAKLIPLAIVVAFNAGIASIIIFNTGKSIVENYHTNEIIITLTVVLISVFASRFVKKHIALLSAIIIVFVIIFFFNMELTPISAITIITENNTNYMPLITVGIEMFFLASLETLLTSTTLDMSYSNNKELMGQGLANLLASCFGGITISGLMIRSSVNISSGAKTRASAVLQSCILTIAIICFYNKLNMFPIAVLSGVLIVSSFSLINTKQIFSLYKRDKIDFFVCVVSFLSMLLIDWYGIQIGLLISFIILIFKTMNSNKNNISFYSNGVVLKILLRNSVNIFSYNAINKIKLFLQNNSVVIFEFTEIKYIDDAAMHYINLIIEESEQKYIFHDANDEQQTLIKKHVKLPLFTFTEHQIQEILNINTRPLELLKHGVMKYNSSPHSAGLLSELKSGQKPHTLLITCSDSRLDPNAFFSAKLGEIFIVRNVGNVVPKYLENGCHSEFAAIEYAINYLNIRNIVLCGHEGCGAVSAAYNNLDISGGLKQWIDIIKAGLKNNFSENPVINNIINQANNIQTHAIIESNKAVISMILYDNGKLFEIDNKGALTKL